MKVTPSFVQSMTNDLEMDKVSKPFVAFFLISMTQGKGQKKVGDELDDDVCVCVHVCPSMVSHKPRALRSFPFFGGGWVRVCAEVTYN